MGHLSSLTYPNASEVSFNPNGFGQSQQATRVGANYATNAKYHPNGIIKTFTYGNGISHTTSLNTRQMPNKIHDHLAGSDRLNLSYTFDYQNNVKSIIDGIDANFSLTHLNYDGLDRLTSTVGGNGIGDSNLSYDGLGNIRTYKTLNSNKDHNFNYQYDTSTFRLTGVTGVGAAGYNFNHSTNGVPDSYDNRGNVTHNGIRSFKYNPLNHMTESDGNQYLYDGFNRRVKIIDSNGTSYSMYSQAGKLLYRETSDGGINYIFLGDKLIAKEGMMPVSTNSRSHYKPFGDSIEAPKDDVGYTGHKFDTDLGWSYMQQRYKDPVVGRFMSNDPVGFRDVHSVNRYVYANNNPYKYTDPTGGSNVLAYTPTSSSVGTTGMETLSLAQQSEGVKLIVPVDEVQSAVNNLLEGNLASAAVSVGMAISKPLGTATKASKMNQKVKKGQAAPGIKRFDSAEQSVPSSQDHVHFDDGTSLNVNGTVHDKKAGIPKPNNEQKKFLKKANWPTEVKKD
ncbi:MAG: RHS repeat-associated protein [Phenylobacterium sp.]